jgi:endothelin-converting enzyme/putative endopeptidase
MGSPRATFLYFLDHSLENKSRDEAIKNQVKRTHSPGMYRAYVPTQNVDAFIRHLTLKGDGMYIEPDKELRSGSS